MVSGAGASSGRELLTEAVLAELTSSTHGLAAVSLRAIARRAGLSHNAATHHFGDRTGLLTAVAVVGFRRLTTALSAAADESATGEDRLAGLGRAYLDFGLSEPNLLELMFRPDLLRRDDSELQAAEQAAFGALEDAMRGDGRPPGEPADLAMVAWAFVHGLAGLARYGALGPGRPADGSTEVGARVAEVMSAFGQLFAAASQAGPSAATSS